MYWDPIGTLADHIIAHQALKGSTAAGLVDLAADYLWTGQHTYRRAAGSILNEWGSSASEYTRLTHEIGDGVSIPAQLGMRLTTSWDRYDMVNDIAAVISVWSADGFPLLKLDNAGAMSIANNQGLLDPVLTQNVNASVSADWTQSGAYTVTGSQTIDPSTGSFATNSVDEAGTNVGVSVDNLLIYDSDLYSNADVDRSMRFSSKRYDSVDTIAAFQFRRDRTVGQSSYHTEWTLWNGPGTNTNIARLSILGVLSIANGDIALHPVVTDNRLLTAGVGIDTLGDLSADRTIAIKLNQAFTGADAWTGIHEHSTHITFTSGNVEVGGIQNQNLLDKSATETISGVWTFQGAAAAGDYSVPDLDIVIGDTDDYGLAALGKSIFGRTSRVTGNLDMDGTVVLVNQGNPSTSNILFAMMDSTNSIRFALPQSGTGNATYNPRSMLIAGPAPNDDEAVTVSYWQGEGIFDNLTCQTSPPGDGADLGVQNDLEVEGDIFTDSIKESTTAAGVTVDGMLIKDGAIPASGVPDGADATAIHDNTSSEISAITEKDDPVAGDIFLMEDSASSNAKKRITYEDIQGQIHCSVDNTGGTTVDTTWRTVPFTADRYSDTIYTRSGGEVTIDADCVLEVIATTCVKPTSGTGGPRGNIQLVLQDDGGTGTWANINNMISYGYTRENFLGSQLLIHQYIPWVSGEAIRMRIRDTVAGGPTQSIKGQTTSLSLRVLRYT